MITLKMLRQAQIVLKEEFERWHPKETIAFGLVKSVKCGSDKVYLLTGIVLFGEDEAKRSRWLTWPFEDAQRPIYKQLKEEGFGQGFRSVTVHVHPFQKRARFSFIDRREMADDKKFYEKIYPGLEFMWLVFSAGMRRALMGALSSLLDTKTSTAWWWSVREWRFLMLLARRQKCRKADRSADTYSRQSLIPGWNQHIISNTRVGFVCLGGLGSAAFDAALMQGLGENRKIVAVECDVMEESNRSRITWVAPKDVGKQKVHVAKRHAKTIRPQREVIAINRPSYSDEARIFLSSRDVLVVSADNDLCRYDMNFLAASFLIPLLDLGAGVSIEEVNGEKVAVSSGQARLFIPGTTPCLLCNMGLDYEDFDRELLKLKMDEEERALLKKTGYLQNFVGDDIDDPNMYTVNAVVANLGIDLLTRYLIGGGIDCHALLYSAEAGVLERIWSESQSVCPVCGPNGVIGKGEFFDVEGLLEDKVLPKPKSYS